MNQQQPINRDEAGTAQEPSDAIWTIPNALTFLRLGLIPVFCWASFGLENAPLAFACGFVGFATDLADGKIARATGQITKLGIRLDPLADRLSLAAGGAVVIVYDLVPLWVVLIILARDALLVLVGVPVVRARGGKIPEVSRLGKQASFLISLGMGLVIASAAVGSFETPSAPWRMVALATLLVAIPLYLASAVGYVRTALAST